MIALDTFPITEKTKERDIKPKTIKTGPLPRKQNKKLSRNNKKFIENVAASGLGINERILNCYF